MSTATLVASPAAEDEKVPLAAWLSLAVLTIVLIYAVIDRQIFILLAEAIKKDMALSDTQLGLLQGVGLALVGVVTIYPISWLADRFDRRVVVAACVLLWSMAVVACGFAPNFAWLMVGASLVGIGEAGITPATFAMIPELFPASKRQLANSTFAVISRFGAAGGVYLAGLMVAAAADLRPWLPPAIAAMHDWRLGFLMAAALSPVAVLLILALPKAVAGRRRPESAAPRDAAPPIWPFLRANWRTQLGFFMGNLVGTMGLAGTAIFIPTIAARDFGQTPAQAGAWMAVMSIVTGLIGFAAGIAVERWFGPRLGQRFEMMLLSGVAFGGALACILIGFSSSLIQLYCFWGVQVTVLTLISMVFPTVLQNMTPPPLRARLFAVIAMFQMVAGGIAPVIVGAASDALTGTAARPLLMAATSLGVITSIITGVIFARLVPGYVAMVTKIREDYE